MRVLPPNDLLLMDKSEARNMFSGTTSEQLLIDIVAYDILRPKAKREIIAFLIKGGSEEELTNIKNNIQSILKQDPTTFVNRFDKTLELQLMMFQFEANNFSSLSDFMTMDANVLRENRNIVLSLGSDASKALSLEVDEEYSHEQLSDLNRKLNTLKPMGSPFLPAIIIEFNQVTMASTRKEQLPSISRINLFSIQENEAGTTAIDTSNEPDHSSTLA